MKVKFIVGICAFLISALLLLYLLFYNGIIWFNNPSLKDYPVRGVDVSSYQGEIDWRTLSVQNISFAYIKATEGSSYQDERFAQNWKDANKTDLLVGAYHFMSYDSSGASQADNYIKTVPLAKGNLPPVIDIEFYGKYDSQPASQEVADAILKELISKLEAHYGVKPMLYATMKSYDLYLKNRYKDYPIWIRNVLSSPTLPDQRKWTCWQYSNRGRLKGYEGKERFIDLNVWNGSIEDIKAYLL